MKEYKLPYFSVISFVMIIMLLASCSESNSKDSSNKPNIIIILADDLGYGDIGVYNDESKISTPNIDGLAKSGLKFTNAHSPSSVCTPTRYGILTGRYAWRTDLKKSVLWAWDKPLIEKDRETIPKMLKKRGYNTANIGKWHMGWRWKDKEGNYINDTIPIGDYGYKGRNNLYKSVDFTKTIDGGPLEAGFDYYFGDDVPNFPPYVFIENNKITADLDTLKPESMFGGPGPMSKGWDLTKVMPAITKRSVEYIEKQAHEKNPFFLYFALTAPHTPIAPTKDFIGKSQAGLYGDFVTEADWTVGQIVDALQRAGQLDNTIIVFSSDNGSPQRDGENMAGKAGSVKRYNHDPSRPFKGMKADIWEGGHRIPCIVSWPNKIGSDQTSNQLFGLNDLIATFSVITQNSGSSSQYEDSQDFSEVWLNNTTTPIRENLVHHSIQGMFAISEGPWKYIEGKGSGGWSGNPDEKPGVILPKGQLYNLEEDIAEKNNVFDEHPEIVEKLSATLNLYREQGYSNPKLKK